MGHPLAYHASTMMKIIIYEHDDNNVSLFEFPNRLAQTAQTAQTTYKNGFNICLTFFKP